MSLSLDFRQSLQPFLRYAEVLDYLSSPDSFSPSFFYIIFYFYLSYQAVFSHFLRLVVLENHLHVVFFSVVTFEDFFLRFFLDLEVVVSSSFFFFLFHLYALSSGFRLSWLTVPLVSSPFVHIEI